MSYFAKPKQELDKKAQDMSLARSKSRTDATDTVSTLGPGMFIRGSIICEGPMQVFGTIFGEIHAVKLTICEGAQVEGKITAQSTTIAGHFKGTIHSESVKLESTAVVDGEIFKKALIIDENAQFEGLTRKLEKPIDLPSAIEPIDDPAALLLETASN